MNQRAFDEDLHCGETEDWKNPEDGVGWKNNPIAKLFESHRQMSHRGELNYRDDDEYLEEQR